MPYIYENLDEDRFQRLAQAVLTTAFPNVQCLPIKQPDGGRDAFLPYFIGGRQEFYVFQVKFSRSPNIKTERDAVEALIASEAEKVETLKKKGATAYYLISNVAGTAHPDAGSIDKVNAALTSAFGIPSYCWWRDDLDSRIDANVSIKWSYPDIIKATDILPALLGGIWGAQSREQALKSYLAIQYSNEEEVKFKQVELQNKLLDLFVDIPVSPIHQSEQQSFVWAQVRAGTVVSASEFIEVDEEEIEYVTVDHDDGPVYIGHGRRSLSASALLLSAASDNNCIVLEGAPGQGKSTITQYICQVNRIKLLGKKSERENVNKLHLEMPTRFPFRVDLRDYASWVIGKNPFGVEQPIVPNASLEAFISAQVTFLSGGHEFSVADLFAFTKTGHVSIVLDGFDEVADIPTRQKVVEEISRAATRLQAHQKDIQLIVTSRPAAFVNSPGFSYETWNHFELQSMTQKQIREYSEKWMNARRLPPKERSEFGKLLNEKLEQPHMRDLARNPMQLTILLALIHTRGLSLPDKRTALYDNYMELFFNREAEKSRVVREHRDLLIDIHRYVAWRLHTAAEQGESDGSVSDSELRSMLSSYLTGEGHDGDLVERLFVGMIERVVALVSRKQGSYEFEVQPLREYFAARHLYETAPYSPPGAEVGGTKPERFDVLARNFYWLNTTRFYCGCYSRGELSSLADGLELLSQDELYRFLAHPRNLAVMLLGDWVFSQQPLLVKRLVAMLFDPITLKTIISNASRGHGVSLTLPEKCGRTELAAKALEALSRKQSQEDRQSVLQIYRSNTSENERLDWWLVQSDRAIGDLEGWLEDGVALGVLAAAPYEKLEMHLSGHEARAIPFLIDANRVDILYRTEYWLKATVAAISSGKLSSGLQAFHRRPLSEINHLQGLVSPYLFQRIFNDSKNFNLIQNISHSYGISIAKLPSDDKKLPDFLDFDLRSLIQEGVVFLTNGKRNWSVELAPWRDYIEIFRARLGNCWALRMLGVVSAGVRSTKEVGEWNDQAWAFDERLCDRIRFARLKSGNVQWWRGQLEQPPINLDDRRLLLLTFITWASPKTLLALTGLLSQVLETLAADEWDLLLKTFRQTNWITEKLKSVIEADMPAPNVEVSIRCLAFLNVRAAPSYKAKIYTSVARSYEGTEDFALTFISSTALRLALESKVSWDEALSKISVTYRAGVQPHESLIDQVEPPIAVCETICASADLFPQFLVRRSQEVLAVRAGGEAVKLKQASEQGKWFER